MTKMLVTLEVDVSLMNDEEAGTELGPNHTMEEYESDELADVLQVEGHEMWAEFFAGSGLFVKFDQTRVVNSYFVE